MRVLKFGGSSIASEESIGRVCRVVSEREGEPMALVFSAVGDTTDRLDHLGLLAAAGREDDIRRQIAALKGYHLDLLDAVCRHPGLKSDVHADWEGLFDDLDRLTGAVAKLGELSPAVRARLLGFGELLSTRLLTAALSASGVRTVWVDARDLIITTGDPMNGEPVTKKTDQSCRSILRPLLASGLVPVTQGFIASSADGAFATLGRGGSDYTAALIGASLAADEVEIWTDVDGVMTADPRLVPAAHCVPTLTLEEAAEIASFGARVLHPRTLVPAIERGISVRVRNTLRPQEPGTLIQNRTVTNGRAVRSVAFRGGMTVINLGFKRSSRIHDVLERAFDVFDSHRVSPEVVSTSETSVAVGCRSVPPGLLAELSSLATVSVTPHQAVVGVVGDGLGNDASLLSRVFDALGDASVTMASIGGSKCTVGFLVDENQVADVVRRLHRRLFDRPAESFEKFGQQPRVAFSA